MITESDPQTVDMSEDGIADRFRSDPECHRISIRRYPDLEHLQRGVTRHSQRQRYRASKAIGYTPNANYNGTDSFVVQVSDGDQVDTITVNVNIAAVNDPPVITGQSALSTMKNTPLALVLANLTVTDVDNTYPTGFTLTVMAGTNYTFVDNTITPDTDFTGILTVPVKVNDSLADSNTYDLNVNVTAGKDYYVDNTNVSCSDSGTGLSPAGPFCTMGKGASKAVAGDTVHVLAGTYAETVKPNSGTAGNPVTFTAEPSPGVTVTGLPGNSTNGGAFRLTSKSYIVVNGFNITGSADYGIICDTSNHITLTNNHVSYSGTLSVPKTGIYLRVTTDSIVSGNTSDHNFGDGIRLSNSSNNNLVENNISFGNAYQSVRDACGIDVLTSNNNTIIHNITYANEDTGLNFYTGSSYNLVVGNVTYGNGDHGIDNNAAPNNVFIGNTVYGNVTVGINVEGATSPGSGGATLMNNISMNNGLRIQDDGSTSTGSAGQIRVDAQSLVGTTLDYNIVYQDSGSPIVMYVWGSTSYATLDTFRAAAPGQESHAVQEDPLLASPAPIAIRPHTAPYNVVINVGDNHITAGSPAIDSANADAPNEPTEDIEGNSRVDDPLVGDTGAGARTYDDRGAYEYQPPSTYTLSISIEGSGGGSVSSDPAGIDCGSSCSADFSYGTLVTLTAAEDPDSTFTGWSGDLVSINNPDSLTINGDLSVTATFILNNQLPVAVDDGFSTDEDTELVVGAAGVLGNDTDADLDPLTAVKVSDPVHGSLTLNSDGSFSYMPEGDYNGVDSFTYKANDGTGDSNTATVEITVNAVNDPPILGPIGLKSVDELVELSFSATAVDIDLPAQTLSFSLSGQPTGAAITSGGAFSWTPTEEQGPGVYPFDVCVSDGLLSDCETISVTVNEVNTAPVANDQSLNTFVNNGLSITLTASDLESDPLIFEVVENPTHGLLSGTAPDLTYTPDIDFAGSDSFTFKANDGLVDSNIATISIVVKTSCEDDPTLVGCWQMEEGSGTVVHDGSSFINDGTLYNSPLWVTGKTGNYALEFNGTNYGLVPDDSSLDITNAITIAAWINPSNAATQDMVKN